MILPTELFISILKTNIQYLYFESEILVGNFIQFLGWVTLYCTEITLT